MNKNLYIIVHHQQDPKLTQWTNVWLDDDRLMSITTPTEVGEYCYEEMQRGKRVFVHRCAWGDSNPVVCCSVKVLQIAEIDEKTSYVIFGDPQVLGTTTPQPAFQGRNFYWDKS